MNWRNEPCPLSFVFTIVSKLKPNMTPLIFKLVTVTGWTDCTVPLLDKLKVEVFKVSEKVLEIIKKEFI